MSSAVTSEYLLYKLRELLMTTVVTDNLTISKLTAHCELSRSTIYRCFPGGMTDLCLELLRYDLAKLLAQEFRAWQYLVAYIVEYMNSHRIFCLNLYRLIINQNLQTQLSQLLKELVEFYIKKQFPHHPICLQEIDFIVGGMLYQMTCWFNSSLTITSEIMSQRLMIGWNMLTKSIKTNQ